MRRLVFAGLIVMVGLASPAIAREKKSFYLGGSLGASQIEVTDTDPDFGAITFDESDFGFKVYGGFRLLGFLAYEGGYVDFGKPSGSFDLGGDLNLDAEIGLKGWDVSALGILPLGIFDVFARVGYFWWDADVRSQIGGESDCDSDSGSDLTYGIGGAVWLGQLSIRAEIEMFDVSEAENVFLYSAGLAYTL